jgi:hypothetical protein
MRAGNNTPDWARKLSKDELIEQAINDTIQAGDTEDDEERFAHIEALLRDALGQSHGVWRWRVNAEEFAKKFSEKLRRAGQ